jgi:hypothetical protein
VPPAGAIIALPVAVFSVWLLVPSIVIAIPLEVMITIPLVLLVLLAIVLSSHRLRDRVPGFLMDTLLGTVGWFASILYLRLFNRRQLDLGSMSRLPDED